ncbi:MAG: hypothetical protein R3D90_09485 [Paracoccaceae bacterium]
MWTGRHVRWAALGLGLMLLPVSVAAQVGPSLPSGGPSGGAEVLRPLTVQAVTEADLIASLEEEGFDIVERERTFLGRVRIVAVGPEGTREVILNPRNGKVLRDLLRRQDPVPPETPPQTPPEPRPALPDEAAAGPDGAAEILIDPAVVDSAARGRGRDGGGSQNRDGGGRDGNGPGGRADRGG